MNLAKEMIEKTISLILITSGLIVIKAAGQSVPHTYIHLIPRYEGDVEDPRGGVAEK